MNDLDILIVFASLMVFLGSCGLTTVVAIVYLVLERMDDDGPQRSERDWMDQ